MSLYGMAEEKNIITWIKEKGVKPLFLCVSGSHMWGLSTAESDLDIRGIYLDPLEKVLALHPGRDNIEAMNILGGNVDIQLYELGKALRMLHANNGNVVEMLLSPTRFFDSGDCDWADLGHRYITRKLSHYYLGYFHSQRTRSAQNRGGKALLYTCREAMAGTVLMRTGQLIHDFWQLREAYNAMYGPSEQLEWYIPRMRWREPVDEERLSRFAIEWDTMSERLRHAQEASHLPESYDGYEYLNRLLLEHRLGPRTSGRGGTEDARGREPRGPTQAVGVQLPPPAPVTHWQKEPE